MDTIFIVLIILGIAGLIAGGVALAAWYEKKRTEALQITAEQIGLEFKPAGDQTLERQLQGMRLMQQGDKRRLTNLIDGETDEVRLSLFDYQYTIGDGKNAHNYKQTVAMIRSPELKLPKFVIRPETLFDRIGGRFGSNRSDINFETHPVFSRKFVLQCDDEEAIRKLFTAEVLTEVERHDGITIEADGHQLLMYRTGNRRKPEEWRVLFREAYQLYGLLARTTQSV